jgi:hypothetical protein
VTSLELFHGKGESLSDLLAAAAQARVLSDLVKDAQKRVDAALRESVDDVSAQTGTAFTARGDGELAGWSAQITAPQPKPVVTDREAFAGWWQEQGWPCQETKRVEVIDHSWAAKLIYQLESVEPRDGTDVDRLLSCVSVTTEVILPEGAADKAAAECEPTDDGGYVHRDTGEVVPGLEWRQQSPQLRVVGSKDAKARARRALVDVLGIPAELAGGV